MKYSRPLIATLLMSGGLFQLVAPVLADGTAANTSISNTATASYEDPTNSGTSINATSNTVTVTVAEVAGLTVTASTITGGAITPGNDLYYNYTITNVGNKETEIRIPNTVGITGPGVVKTTAGTNPAGIEYSIDGGATWIALPANTPSVTGANTPLVGVNSSVLVRVAVTVTSATGSSISVRLGNTPNNQPNQAYVPSGAFDDVYTVGGNPANGQRESSAVLSGTVGSTAKNIALATVLATRTGTSNNNTPSNLADDTVSYELKLKVEGTDVTNSGITPAALAGTDINVGGVTAKHILVSNAIPAGTTLTAAATAPAGWTAVYTSTDPTAATANAANAATWTTTFSANPTTPYTRVGFISNSGTVVAPGTTIDNFVFTVTTTGKTGTSYTVDSMTQAFGTTSGATGTAADVIVYDESGDQTPNAEYSSTAPLTTTTSTFTGAPSANGIALATYGVDTSNNNSGSGVYGEINQFTFTYTVPVANSLLNGPSGSPQADGPDALGVISNNFDFTNKSSAVPAGSAPNSTIDPASVGFTNTVRNTGTETANISLLPELVTAGVLTNALPVDTEVRIYTAAGQSATYKVTTAGFIFVSGSGTSNGVAISATVPVALENVGSNALATYQVAVDLPDETTLSTDTLKGFAVAINAFTGGTVAANLTVTGATASNKTIDRVYTGFVKLAKETRILPGSGPTPQPADINFSTTLKTPAAGNIIEYRITYSNISTTQVGSSNTVLNAGSLVITEDGTTATNKWGQDGDSNGIIDTSNVVGSALNTGTVSTIELYKDTTGLNNSVDQSGTTASTDITKYINRVTTVVAPGTNGTFSFQRKLN